MKKFNFIIIIFLSFSMYAQNNLDFLWQGCYGGSENDEAYDVIQTNNGYLIFGETNSFNGNVSNNHGDSDIWIVSIDSTGNILWERCYGGSEPEYPNNIIKANNAYYFGAWTFSNDGDIQSMNHGGTDRWIVKIDENGDILWEKCYGGSGVEYGGNLIQLQNGNILSYAASTSDDGDVPVNYGYLDVWLMIISPEGEILKSEVFGNIGQNNVFDMVETNDGGFFMASKAEEVEGMVQGDFHGNTDVWAVKLDKEMNIEWQKLYGGSQVDYGYSGVLELTDGYLFLAVTSSNDFDVSGFHGTSGYDEPSDIWAVRIDTVGNIVWQKCLGGWDWDKSSKLSLTDDGNFMIFGRTSSNGGDVTGNHSWDGCYDIWLVKIDSEGDIIWQQCYGGINDDRILKGVCRINDNDWIIAGSTKQNSGNVSCNLKGYKDYWVFEIKDCDYYTPATPETPAGDDTVCSGGNTQTVYATLSATNAWSYQWKIEPEEAGTITGDSLQATTQWTENYEGSAAIMVRGINDCGEGIWSQPRFVQVVNCLGIAEQQAGDIRLKVYPNPAREFVVFELNKASRTGTIVIYNSTGTETARLQTTGNRTTWHTGNIKPGLFFYRVETEEKVLSGKIVISGG